MERPRHLSVLTDTGVDARVRVCLGRVLQVEGDVGHRLSLVVHAPCLEVQALLALMCRPL